MQPDPSAAPVAAVPPMPGYPAFITLLAFYIFNVEKVDLAILETGMGEETDSTNVVVAPVATGISELGLDHVNKLGNSIESIAWHKSGIFKAGVAAFSVTQSETATEMLKERAGEKRTKVEFVDDEFLVSSAIKVVPNVAFQRSNASLALALVGAYAKQTISPGRITSNIAQCLEHTELPAKFEVVPQGKVSWVLSSAHNDTSINAACQTFLAYLQEYVFLKLVLVSIQSFTGTPSVQLPWCSATIPIAIPRSICSPFLTTSVLIASVHFTAP